MRGGGTGALLFTATDTAPHPDQSVPSTALSKLLAAAAQFEAGTLPPGDEGMRRCAPAHCTARSLSGPRHSRNASDSEGRPRVIDLLDGAGKSQLESRGSFHLNLISLNVAVPERRWMSRLTHRWLATAPPTARTMDNTFFGPITSAVAAQRLREIIGQLTEAID